MFATTQEQRLNELRREYVAIAVEFLKAGSPEGCVAAMTDCLQAQSKVAGGGLRGYTPVGMYLDEAQGVPA